MDEEQETKKPQKKFTKDQSYFVVVVGFLSFSILGLLVEIVVGMPDGNLEANSLASALSIVITSLIVLLISVASLRYLNKSGTSSILGDAEEDINSGHDLSYSAHPSSPPGAPASFAHPLVPTSDSKTTTSRKALQSDGAWLHSLTHNSRQARSEISASIQQIYRRANLNLTFGISISLIAIFQISWFLSYRSELHHNLGGVAFYFLPRLSLVGVTELIAFFFLRMYRQSLAAAEILHHKLFILQHEEARIGAGLALHRLGAEAVLEQAIGRGNANERE